MSEYENNQGVARSGAMNTRRRGRTISAEVAVQVPLSTTSTNQVTLNLPDTFDGLEMEAVVAHVLCQQATTNFRYVLDLRSSYDGIDWPLACNVVPFTTDQAPPSYKICDPPLTSRSKFGKHVRFELGYKSSDGNAANALVSVLVVLTYLIP